MEPNGSMTTPFRMQPLMSTRRAATFCLLLLGLALATSPWVACTGPENRPTLPTQPYAMVLGTAQDAGLPQIACRRECCELARANPTLRRLATSLLLVDPRDGRRWLFDATPDLPEQIERARGHGKAGNFDSTTVGRPPLFDGIFLTHAHMGHCAGLLHLGREAYGSEPIDVYATPRMCEFLEAPGLFGLLVSGGHVAPKRLTPEVPHELAPDLHVRAIRVPHRDECSDTVAFCIEGPERTVLYLPDIDKWERWNHRLGEFLQTVDVAYLDGSFYGAGEIPGRDMSQIPHPFVVETMTLLENEPAEIRSKVRFLHLNHSNPAAQRDGSQVQAIRAGGYNLAEPGELFGI